MDTIRILITDDDASLRAEVARILKNSTLGIPDVDREVAFAVDQAHDASNALEKIERDPPDILLLDYMMPNLNGLQLLASLEKMREVLETADPDAAHALSEMLVVMISGTATIHVAMEAAKKGVYSFLTKPFSPEVMLKTVQEAAEHLVLVRQTRKLEEQRRRVRAELIRVLGHELKAPLNALDGYLTMMKDRTLGDSLADYEVPLQRAVIRIEGMRRLINDLLDMTRVEAGDTVRRLVQVEFNALVRDALDLMQPIAAPRNISLNLHADQSVFLLADPGEIAILINNLVSNAVKYNRDGGRVDVTLTRTEKNVILTVTDTGIGMTPDEQARLFGEFVRIKNEKTRDIMGTGLGLSVVKRLVKAYHGTVEVHSIPDSGTTFTVTLPTEIR